MDNLTEIKGEATILEIIPVKLTKRALNEFIGWTTSRYNDYLGFGTKKEAVEKVFHSINRGCFVHVQFSRKGERLERPADESKTVFVIECASPCGERPTNKSGSTRNWGTKQSGDEYTVDCKQRTITAKYSKRVIKFL